MDDYNIKIANIWDELYKDPAKSSMLGELLIPTPYPEIKKTKFLCIGMNPSFSTDWWYAKIKSDNRYQSQLKDVDEEEITTALAGILNTKKEIKKEVSRRKAEIMNEFYKFQGKELFIKNLSYYISLESIGVGKHSYFKKIDQLATELYGSTKDYIHLDLFSFKCTSSYQLLRYINAVPSFFEKQLEVFKEIVNEIQPEVILVANADASKIVKLIYFDNKKANFLKKFKTDFVHDSYRDVSRKLYNSDFGYYNFQNGCKVFFSGMLSQQRALDLDSFDRLKLALTKVLSVNPK